MDRFPRAPNVAPGLAFTRAPLRLEELLAHDKGSFDRLYELYAVLFPLPDEREPPEAFLAILALNENLTVQRNFGPYREVVAAARLWQGGPVVGGHVFGVTTSTAHLATGVPASVQAIYTFLESTARGQLPMPTIKRYSEQVALSTFGLEQAGFPSRPLIFFEANNPLRMSPAEVESDTHNSGLAPARRYMFWRRSGFAPLDFPYVQPRLRPDAEPVHFLDLFCSSDGPPVIPSALLLHHLHAFVSVSVRKGEDARDDPDFRAMEDWLRRNDVVRFKRLDSAEQCEIAALGRALRQGSGA